CRIWSDRLSINALREDLQVTHKTVAHWLQIPDRLYARLSAVAVRRAAHPGGQEGAEALPLGLERRGAGTPLREPRGRAPPEVGPLPAGRQRGVTSSSGTSAIRTGEKSTSRSWSAASLSCSCCKWSDAEVDRPPQPQRAVSQVRSVADFGDRYEGLRHAG